MDAVKLTLTCEHGQRTVEFDEGREGIASVVFEMTPRCPYCKAENAPCVVMVAKNDGGLEIP